MNHKANTPEELMEWIAAGAKPKSEPPVAGAAPCSAAGETCAICGKPLAGETWTDDEEYGDAHERCIREKRMNEDYRMPDYREQVETKTVPSGPLPLAPAQCSVRTCEVCGRTMTEKRYEHGKDVRTYWTCDLAEGSWASGAAHFAEDAPENRKSPNERTVSDERRNNP